MKRALGALGGLTLGAAVALVLLYFNPLTDSGAPDSEPAGWALDYELPVGTLLLTHSGRLKLPLKPVETDLLWERTVRKSMLSGFVLADADGGAAAASRVSLTSPQADLLTRGVLLNDYWLLSVPGEGTLAILADTNAWPLLKDALVPAWYLGREWNGSATYAATAGPAPGNEALVVGLSGRFAGVRGSAVEQYVVRRVDASGTELGGRLFLRLPDEEDSGTVEDDPEPRDRGENDPDERLPEE